MVSEVMASISLGTRKTFFRLGFIRLLFIYLFIYLLITTHPTLLFNLSLLIKYSHYASHCVWLACCHSCALGDASPVTPSTKMTSLTTRVSHSSVVSWVQFPLETWKIFFSE